MCRGKLTIRSGTVTSTHTQTRHTHTHTHTHMAPNSCEGYYRSDVESWGL